MSVIVTLFMCYFTDKLVISVSLHTMVTTTKTSSISSIGTRWWFGCHSAVPFLSGLIQINLSYQEPASSSYYINPCTTIQACEHSNF